MKSLSEPTEIEKYDFPYQAPLTPVDEACFGYRRFTETIEPEDLSVIERRLFDVNPRDHAWRKEFFDGLPTYLAKYFANRYIDICEKESLKEANTFLRNKMRPASERVRMVLAKYKKLPTTQKVALLSEEYGDTKQSDFVKPYQAKKEQMRFDFEMIEKNRKPVKSRILAELEQDELKEMAFKISQIVGVSFQLIAEKVDKTELTEEETAEAIGYEELAQFVCQFGIKPPRKRKKQTDLTALNDISRMLDDKWWLGRLVKARKIMREHLAIAMGQVSSKASVYCSWDCLREHKEQQSRNWEAIQNRLLRDEETGEEVALDEMVLRSVSNPAIRRHELMVRCRGCEDIGNELGLQGLFLTLTAPSKYHNSYKKGGFIDHWNGASPRDTQTYLNTIWQRIRAKLGREEIRWFGVRVAEPHHDGTPHWHLLLWVKPEEVAFVRDVFITYATKEDRNELHPKQEKEKKKPFRKGDYVGPLDYRPRCDIGLIDPALGTATGYIAKYISKNIDGYAMDAEMSDEAEKPVKEMAKNVNAWKSRWSIRQFQFFGGAPVTTYRELRRFANQNKKAFMEYVFMQKRVDLLTIYSMLQRDLVGPIKPSKLITNEELMKVISDSYQARGDSKQSSVAGTLAAADHGNWQGYIMGQGGPFVKRADLLIVNSYEVLPFASPHGEDVRKIEGFITPEETVKTRTKSWTIVKRSQADIETVHEFEKPTPDPETWRYKGKKTIVKKTDNVEAGALALSGSAAASRSSVNNCTEPKRVQVSNQLKNIFAPNQKNKKVDTFVDENALNALLNGSSLNLHDGRSLKIRPAELDSEGNIRPAQLIEIEKEPEDMRWLEFDGWPDEPKPTNRDEYEQPNLSIFTKHDFGDDDWPLI
ncbi:replication endonuclease [Aliivibrio kagoshimensis]|uniref:replication endonuclease n=1 Tax=Aliivibrio kagoshimensis TaxID=2910230 RepID=UPI003D0AB510